MMNKKRIAAGGLAAALTITSLAGCAGGNGKKDGETTEVSWYLSGVKMDSSWDDVWNKVNELMTERYNLKLNINMIDGRNFSQKIQMMNASQEPYDLAFTSNWSNDYSTNVANGSLLDLTDKLPEVTPKLWDDLSDAEKKGAAVNGKIYAVPNWQVQARAMGFIFPKELLDKSGMSIDDFKSFDDLETYYGKIAEIDPVYNSKNSLNWQVAMTNYGYATLVKEGLPGVIDLKKEGKPQVINQFETDEFMEFCKMARKFVEKGYMPSVTDNKNYDGTGIIRCSGGVINWKPGAGIEEERRKKYEIADKKISDALLSTESIISTMTGVGVNSKHPDEALKVLEIMRTDKEIYNMLSFGLEGVDYEKLDGEFIRVNPDSNYTIPNWSIGSVAHSYILEGNPETLWEDTKEHNDSAIVSPLMGFQLDSEPILAELGNCETVLKEYIDTLQAGRVDPEVAIPKLREELKVAGVDTVLEEVQKQIDAWWEENAK